MPAHVWLHMDKQDKMLMVTMGKGLYMCVHERGRLKEAENNIVSNIFTELVKLERILM